MNSERKISCTIVNAYKWFSDKMFEPDVLRKSFVEQNQDGGIPEIMSEVFATWVDTVVESVTENKINTQSDNILDLISELEAVIDENFTEEEKKEIIKIIESDVMKKFLNTGSVYEKIFDSKKDMQSKIMSTIYSEENDRKFRSRVSDKFPGIELDSDGHGFDI